MSSDTRTQTANHFPSRAAQPICSIDRRSRSRPVSHSSAILLAFFSDLFTQLSSEWYTVGYHLPRSWEEGAAPSFPFLVAVGGCKLLTPVDELDVSEAAVAVVALVPRADLEAELLQLGAEQGLPLRHGGNVVGVDLGDLVVAVALEDGVPLTGEVEAVGVVALGLDVGGAAMHAFIDVYMYIHISWTFLNPLRVT